MTHTKEQIVGQPKLEKSSAEDVQTLSNNLPENSKTFKNHDDFVKIYEFLIPKVV